jgi:flagellar motility protein MotE (MotC chaperone)
MMTKIVHEIPDELELELEGEEVEVSLDEGKAAKPGKSTADVERVVQDKSGKPEFDFEIEEEDDTPLEDRGKDPLPDDIVEQLENDTLEDYSERVKQRMAQLKKSITTKDVLRNLRIESEKKLFVLQKVLRMKIKS